MNKKRWAVVLSFALIVIFATIITTVAVDAYGGEDWGDWGGTAATSFASGSGTEDDPYIIKTENQFYLFNQILLGNATLNGKTNEDLRDDYYKLGANIIYNNVRESSGFTTDILIKKWGEAGLASGTDTTFTYDGNTYDKPKYEWIPPGLNKNTSTHFEGSFDGDGHIIYGLYINQPTDSSGVTSNWVGLFGMAKYATISNLSIESSYIVGGNYTAALVGRAKVAVDIFNCTIGDQVHISGNNYVGSFIGGNISNSFTSSITPDDSNEDILFSGTLGSEDNISNYTITQCRSKAYVSGVAGVGGIAGYSNAGAARVQIIQCTNYGEITGTKWVGGILGGVRNADGYGHNNVDSCYNYGLISGATYIGGIVGYGHATDVYDCYNSGAVSGEKSIGGIVGGTEIFDTLACSDILYCYNEGTVTGSGGVVGGIVGRAISINVEQCANEGAVSGLTCIGGIAGSVSAATVAASGNTGATSVSGAGNVDIQICYINDCYNLGSVNATDGKVTCAGIVGRAYYASATVHCRVTNCINGGDVITGTVNGGAIVHYSAGTYTDASSGNNYALSDKYASYDACTAVTSLASKEVYANLTTNWSPNYPMPTLNNITVVSQDPSGAGGTITTASLNAVASLPGIKATVIVTNSSLYQELVKTYGEDSITCGTLIAWEEDLGGMPLTIDTGSAQNVVCDSGKYKFDDNFYYQATLSVTDSTQYNKTAVFRGYIQVKAAEDSYIYCYSSPLTASLFTANGSGELDASLASFTLNGSATKRQSLYMLPRKSYTGEANPQHTWKMTVPFTLECPEDAIVTITATRAASNDDVAQDSNDAIIYDYDSISVSTSGEGRDTVITVTVASDITSVAESTYLRSSIDITATVVTDAGTAEFTYKLITKIHRNAGNAYANKLAASDGKFYLQTNTLDYQHYTITKNDGYIMYYNGTVFMVDSGNPNTESLDHLLAIREKFIQQNVFLKSDGTNEPYGPESLARLTLSPEVKLSIILFITHYHGDHVGAIREVISQSPYIEIAQVITITASSSSTASGHNSGSITPTDAAINANNADVVWHRVDYGEKRHGFYIKGIQDGITDNSQLTAGSAALNNRQSYSPDNNMITEAVYNTLSDAEKAEYVFKIFAYPPTEDWSANSNTNSSSTTWVNANSVWYLVKFNDQPGTNETHTQILFTGDTYTPDTGTTYSVSKGDVTYTGNTPVDAMLAKHTSVGSNVDILVANHHGRSAYNENLFSVTTPTITLTGLYYGLADIRLINKATETGTVYVSGDGPKLFTIDVYGNITDASDTLVSDTSNKALSYYRTSAGKARRVRYNDLRFGVGDVTECTVNWGDLNFRYRLGEWNTNTHTYGTGEWTYYSTEFTIQNTGATTLLCEIVYLDAGGGVPVNFSVDGVAYASGVAYNTRMGVTGSRTLKIEVADTTAEPHYNEEETVIGAIIITYVGEH